MRLEKGRALGGRKMDGSERVTLVSAPGKVLLTGGYLVLEKPNSGLVLSTSARFYALVQPLPASASKDESTVDVLVTSPQLGRQEKYKLSLEDLQLQSHAGTFNPFIAKAVCFAVAAAEQLQGKEQVAEEFKLGLELIVAGDNDFYSHRQELTTQGLPLTSASLAKLPPFSPACLNTPENESLSPEIAKTGLGSSAAMTTAAVAALLQYLGVLELPASTSRGISRALETSSDCREQNLADGTSEDPDLCLRKGKSKGSGGLLGVILRGPEALGVVHSIAQAAHCSAQGKVGSGFDVSAAVYGSQSYVRFSPEVLSEVMSVREFVAGVMKAEWDCHCVEYALPPGLVLMVGEPGTGGSSTPSMVGKVQQWRKESPEAATQLWRDLAAKNAQVEQSLRRLQQLNLEDKHSYGNALGLCSTLPASQWLSSFSTHFQEQLVVEALVKTREAFSNVRALLKDMGKRAGSVPIEPDQQTELLDATMLSPGVLMAGVPGAGGYDAVFAVVLGEGARQRVDLLWSKLNTLALCTRECRHGVLLELDDSPVLQALLRPESGIDSISS